MPGAEAWNSWSDCTAKDWVLPWLVVHPPHLPRLPVQDAPKQAPALTALAPANLSSHTPQLPPEFYDGGGGAMQPQYSGGQHDDYVSGGGAAGGPADAPYGQGYGYDGYEGDDSHAYVYGHVEEEEAYAYEDEEAEEGEGAAAVAAAAAPEVRTGRRTPKAGQQREQQLSEAVSMLWSASTWLLYQVFSPQKPPRPVAAAAAAAAGTSAAGAASHATAAPCRYVLNSPVLVGPGELLKLLRSESARGGGPAVPGMTLVVGLTADGRSAVLPRLRRVAEAAKAAAAEQAFAAALAQRAGSTGSASSSTQWEDMQPAVWEAAAAVVPPAFLRPLASLLALAEAGQSYAPVNRRQLEAGAPPAGWCVPRCIFTGWNERAGGGSGEGDRDKDKETPENSASAAAAAATAALLRTRSSRDAATKAEVQAAVTAAAAAKAAATTAAAAALLSSCSSWIVLDTYRCGRLRLGRGGDAGAEGDDGGGEAGPSTSAGGAGGGSGGDQHQGGGTGSEAGGRPGSRGGGGGGASAKWHWSQFSGSEVLERLQAGRFPPSVQLVGTCGPVNLKATPVPHAALMPLAALLAVRRRRGA